MNVPLPNPWATLGVLAWSAVVVRWRTIAGPRIYSIPAPTRLSAGLVLASILVWLAIEGLFGWLVPVKELSGANAELFALVIGRNACLLAILPLFLWRVGRIEPWQIGLRRPTTMAITEGLWGVAGWGPLVFMANLWIRHFVPQDHPHLAQRFVEQPHPLPQWLIFFVAAAVSAPLAEELLFRGILQTWLARRLGQPVGIGMASLAFGFAHLGTWPDPLPLVLLSIGLGLAYTRTRSLWAPVVMHGGFNGGMLLLAILLKLG